MKRRTFRAASKQVATRVRPLAQYVICGAVLAALVLIGHGVLWPNTAQNRSQSLPRQQTVPLPYQRVPALLAQARLHDPLLRLPHARWFIRLKHRQVRLIVVDHTTLGSDQGTLTLSGKSR